MKKYKIIIGLAVLFIISCTPTSKCHHSEVIKDGKILDVICEYIKTTINEDYYCLIDFLILDQDYYFAMRSTNIIPAGRNNDYLILTERIEERYVVYYIDKKAIPAIVTISEEAANRTDSLARATAREITEIYDGSWHPKTISYKLKKNKVSSIKQIDTLFKEMFGKDYIEFEKYHSNKWM